MQTAVAKFGGTSVAQHIECIDAIIRSQDIFRKYIVVSAPGRRRAEDSKVTDLLLSLRADPSDARIDDIISRYRHICDDATFLAKSRRDLVGRLKRNDAAIAAFGEEMSARAFAQRLGISYMDPPFILDPQHGYDDATLQSMRDVTPPEGHVVIPGFFGFTEDGDIATFSRGGSDLTGAYMASLFQVDVYENFTDGPICAASPKIVRDPQVISEITYEELRNLSYSGFEVLHPRVMLATQQQRIPVHVRGTEQFPEKGTRIVTHRHADLPIVGIAYRNGFGCFTLSFPGLNETEGLMYQVHEEFHSQGVPVEHDLTGIDEVSIVVDTSRFGSASPDSIARGLHRRFDCSLDYQEDFGLLVVTGMGMRGRRGISAEIETVLADMGASIRFKTQTTRETSIIFGMHDSYGHDAVRALYAHFF